MHKVGRSHISHNLNLSFNLGLVEILLPIGVEEESVGMNESSRNIRIRVIA